MDLMTKIAITPSGDKITHRQQIMMFGSCFTENIGNYLQQMHFRCDVNPFGILYNPLSIGAAFDLLLSGESFDSTDLFLHGNLHHSFMHHSRFSATDPHVGLQHINRRFHAAASTIHSCDRIIITFGTAYVYRLRESGLVVANCHKLPENEFERERISVEIIVAEWSRLIAQLQSINRNLKIIFTVSPIRHLRDGAHENQLSKSTLLLAIDSLCQQFAACSYFPAYEIMMDELRDYRFYAQDMTHPTEQTIEYIREKFGHCFFDDETNELNRFWLKFMKAIQHRPLTSDKSAYKDFLMQNLFKLKLFHEKYPFFDIIKEEEHLKQLLHEI